MNIKIPDSVIVEAVTTPEGFAKVVRAMNELFKNNDSEKFGSAVAEHCEAHEMDEFITNLVLKRKH